jgi:hypothetical protein
VGPILSIQPHLIQREIALILNQIEKNKQHPELNLPNSIANPSLYKVDHKSNRAEREEKMAGHSQVIKTRVVRIDSEKSWDFFINQATNKECPVSNSLSFFMRAAVLMIQLLRIYVSRNSTQFRQLLYREVIILEARIL